MNEQLDLTTKPPNKKWYSKAWIRYLIVLLAVLGLGYLLISRSLNSDNKLTNYDEDQLPAIKVLVLNGCGYEQLATEFSAHLANKNIDVISVGDTPKPIYDKSIIVMRKEDKNDLERLMRMTGIQRWTSALNEYHNADFDIIVGRDYEEFMK
ncbi:MAG: LytR C-terminal domain-containing protein [Candidatus Cloacimonetes bacterium]|jgi:hypothetical protein|nr:LytR C-terminal domain-containing protein [Candidatus Cloacimonadota bacterium]MCB5278434.1 LytR C-terminal domain-containing protein [Candidatus Cloacimonadota bacterium]MDD3282432.1 LytR C-terminal domain-containing protein [Candidatus Cloacimonadota bacterium]MDD4231458.1 LytR C-terminal domain-containing protein [Candidatus Cloacimonadota bacterium]MDY0299277.1 LytR C-terminal domain-containing protein [Candidatus Cloacimonadaceae bacterium]